VNALTELEIINEYLAKTLSTKRYMHSENTAKTARELAIIYKEDEQKAYIAGLIHDCTREIDIEIQHKMLEAMGLRVDDITFNSKELLHSITAEYLITNKFKIYDGEIISAIRFHTTGKENMTMLEKIIFISDAVEPSRSYPNVDYVRQLSTKNLDEALLAAFDSSISFLLDKRSLIHPNTFMARNYVLRHITE
jgi:predicted HD superfamily hydrolase involved in NAD metabolism